jgi:hypothetical protein
MRPCILPESASGQRHQRDAGGDGQRPERAPAADRLAEEDRARGDREHDARLARGGDRRRRRALQGGEDEPVGAEGGQAGGDGARAERGANGLAVAPGRDRDRVSSAAGAMTSQRYGSGSAWCRPSWSTSV